MISRFLKSGIWKTRVGLEMVWSYVHVAHVSVIHTAMVHAAVTHVAVIHV